MNSYDSPPPEAPLSDGSMASTPRWWEGHRFRQIVIWLTAGSAAVTVLLVAVMIVMGDGDDQDGAGSDASTTPTASASAIAIATATPTAMPTASPTAMPTASPMPTATAAPTATATPVPATHQPVPPAALLGGWAQVTTELNLREEPAVAATSVDRLPADEVVWVAGGPEHRDGYDWYLVQSIGRDSGWIASGAADDPFATSLSQEETLLWCGTVESGNGIRVNGLRPGPLDAAQRGALALADATQTEACVTYVLEDNEPGRYLGVFLDACGAPVWDGQRLILKPTSYGDVINDYKVKRTIEVASALLTERSAVDEDSLTNKLKVFLLGGQLARPFACMSVRIREEEPGGRRESVYVGGECLVLTELTDTYAVVKPAAGGHGVSFTRTSTVAFTDIEIGEPTIMNVFATTTTSERFWMGGFGAC